MTAILKFANLQYFPLALYAIPLKVIDEALKAKAEDMTHFFSSLSMFSLLSKDLNFLFFSYKSVGH